MFEFLKRAFGQPPLAKPTINLSDQTPTSVRFIDKDDVAPQKSVASGALSGKASVDYYFELSNIIVRAKSDGDFPRAVRAARNTYPLLPAVVRQMKKEFGSFDISTSHAIHTAGTLMAVLGELEGISELRQALTKTKELHDWMPVAEQAELDATLVNAIKGAVIAQPGIKQSNLKACINGDGRRIGILVASMEKGNRIQRISHPPTYLLYPAEFPLDLPTVEPDSTYADSANSIPASALRSPSSRPFARARKISLKNLPYVRLPKAPLAWEESRRQSEELKERETRAKNTDADIKTPRSTLPRFVVLGNGWALAGEEALPTNERPDPAYRQVFHTAGSTIWIDPKGQRVGFPTASAVALSTDRAGVRIAERGLPHDIYRSDVNADGSGMLFLSREGVLHGYTETLEPIVAESVADIPEYKEQSKRFGIDSSQLKNHTRCVSISSDRSRSLITVVDEAWCYDVATGKPIWGLRFPSKEGWTEIAADRSEVTGASSDITAALRLMELTLPVSPETITRQYKALAMRWHPDRNPQNPNATRQFQDLGAAFRLLTGIDMSRYSSSQIEGIAYEQMLHQSSIKLPSGLNITITMSMQVSGSFAVDWVYAANFAHAGHSTFLSGYSGRIIEVDASGNPLRVYDIGALPREVADTPLHRYILTDTRLYVLSGDKLVALIDVFDKGKLIVGDQGFGLLQSKQFQWFTPTGDLLGEVQTRDPIRRIYSGLQNLVIETRSHRGIISGAQSWW